MMPVRYRVLDQLTRRSSILASAIINRQLDREIHTTQCTPKGKDDNASFTSLFRPVPVKLSSDDINVGAELSGNLRKADLMKIITVFAQKPEIKTLALECGLNSYLLTEALKSFRQHCMKATTLPVDLHIIFSDILQGAGNVTDIFPYFIRHAKSIFPHIDCLDDLKKISDLRSPANWYPIARSVPRKIIFHAGPTNSGKTYQALERFMNAKSGVYCGPLKLLVAEIFEKTNKMGTACDLITGEERRYAINENTPATHLSCSVEMVDLQKHYEVAVIDEIQLVRDLGRGWAWTRALLGIPANEIHLCGEEAAMDLVNSLCMTTGEDLEIRKYKRLTQLKIEEKAVTSFENTQPGDCIVCFNKSDIFTVTRSLESRGKEVAVIYGSLPPGTKLAQAAKFNDPNNSCKIMVATNAIGMGLNLHIRRVIFFSLLQPTVNEKGEREMDTISVSSALQIAGRAGRYGTKWETGYVTTFKEDDLPTLRNLLHKQPEPIKKAGLHPTADQIELYAYHLPDTPLSNLMDIFVSLCTVDDSLYFMCNIEDFKFFADMIQHVPLPLRARYVFCCAPINRKMPFVCSMFLKFVRQFSKNEKITFSWMCQHIGWPFTLPKSLLDLVHLEAVFDVLDVYLWLSYRFMDLFPDAKLVKDIQKELDMLIQHGVYKLAILLRNADVTTSATADSFEMETRKQNFHRNHYNRRRTAKGRLTDRLLSEGLLTPQMLQELQREWSKDSPDEDDKKHKK